MTVQEAAAELVARQERKLQALREIQEIIRKFPELLQELLTNSRPPPVPVYFFPVDIGLSSA